MYDHCRHLSMPLLCQASRNVIPLHIKAKACGNLPLGQSSIQDLIAGERRNKECGSITVIKSHPITSSEIIWVQKVCQTRYVFLTGNQSRNATCDWLLLQFFIKHCPHKNRVTILNTFLPTRNFPGPSSKKEKLHSCFSRCLHRVLVWGWLLCLHSCSH